MIPDEVQEEKNMNIFLLYDLATCPGWVGVLGSNIGLQHLAHCLFFEILNELHKLSTNSALMIWIVIQPEKQDTADGFMNEHNNLGGNI